MKVLNDLKLNSIESFMRMKSPHRVVSMIVVVVVVMKQRQR